MSKLSGSGFGFFFGGGRGGGRGRELARRLTPFRVEGIPKRHHIYLGCGGMEVKVYKETTSRFVKRWVLS